MSGCRSNGRVEANRRCRDSTVVIRGDLLDPELLAESAQRNFDVYGFYGISVFAETADMAWTDLAATRFIGCFAGDVDAFVGEQPGQSGAHQHHVVGDYDAHGITALTTDPVVVGSMLSSPPTAPMRSVT